MKSRLASFVLVPVLAVGLHHSANADVRVGVGVSLPGLSIGINVPAYPQLVPVPGYPVYYAPGIDLNLFFYDGLYWVYTDDNWYSSAWYDGPWDLVQPDLVPYFVLRVPVLYYRRPPLYFRYWDRRQAPRWDQHWGATWRDRHRAWDRWDRARPPVRAPLPAFQRQYSGPRYPGATEQRRLENHYYRMPPRPNQQRPGENRAPQRMNQAQPRENRAPQRTNQAQPRENRAPPPANPPGPRERRGQPQDNRDHGGRPGDHPPRD